MPSPRALLHRLLKPWVDPMHWPLKRPLLQGLFGYDLAPSARIGLAWGYSKQLQMAAGSLIDHFTVSVNLDSLELGEKVTIGRSNWITGFPRRHWLSPLRPPARTPRGALVGRACRHY